MRNRRLVNAIAIGLTLALITGAGSLTTTEKKASSSTLCKEMEMAGISVSLDRYYADKYGEEADVADSATESAVEENGDAEKTAEKKDSISDENKGAATGAAVKEDSSSDNSGAPAGTPSYATGVAQPTTGAAAAEQPVVSEQFVTTALSIAHDYVNIRKSPSTEGKILGKLYEGSSCKIVSEEGDWTKIESGSVAGYIKSEFLAKGAKAESLASKYGKYYASLVPGTITLNMRSKPNTSSTIITQLPEDEEYEVTKIGNSWVTIMVDGDKGYVAKEFVNLKAKFKHAKSIEEEQEELRRAEEARIAEEERLEQERLEREAEQEESSGVRTYTSSSSSSSSSSSNSTSSSSSSSGNRSTASSSSGSSRKTSSSSSSSSSRKSGTSSSSSSSSRKSGTSSSSSSSSRKSSSASSSSSSSSSGSSSGSSIAQYAQKFVGNRYVYGGSSLTHGTDCSGFTMSVYSKFGYSLPHSAASQSGCGRKVSMSNLQPGDLLFYKNGSRIGHVAMYIGGGRVVHASNPSDGIKISSYNYRTPCTARRIIG